MRSTSATSPRSAASRATPAPDAAAHDQQVEVRRRQAASMASRAAAENGDAMRQPRG
jgi:hypothetical protein